MDIYDQRPHAHLFTIRVWEEDMNPGEREWRGRVQLVSSLKVRYFHQWDTLVPLLLTMLSEGDSLSEPDI